MRAEHQRARRSLAAQLAWELDVDDAAANRLAHEAPISRPSGYAVAATMNFLTTTDAIPQSSEAIERLMRDSLVPGGTILVLGAVGGRYPEIYDQLDDLATAAHLNVLPDFDQPLQAGHRADELAEIRDLTRRLWNRLETTAGDVTEVKEELRRCGAADIFDISRPFTLPRFNVRAYRRGM
ncbi:hypothetical protein OG874_21630 [Nocardia sp. NBC_00565]|uniref:hypothetical protein n=1 Tax=Nocardia sp. NBC_00565 TaxID=2975993 RepID=UPI002E804B07|nr:hypothetical protein [Nocardia sp. NBC_00565]WUC07526.1 hypothetical protein OG874_21630 [Nocardia sp. NBC_00565]